MIATRPFFPGLRSELDRVFDAFVDNGPAAQRPFPALNVWHNGDDVFAEAELPGLRMEDLEIYVRGSELTIKGARQATGDDNAVYVRRERGVGEFTRYLELPFEIDAERVEAELKDGVLTVRMPKSERAKARRIQVRGA